MKATSVISLKRVHWIDSSADGLSVPEGIILPVDSVAALM